MRSSHDRVLALQARLTDRDRQLLAWLADHKVLTTFQISYALFGSLEFAQRRLLTLHRLGLIDRFRPLRMGGGSYPWHYVLGQIGAEHVASTREQTPPRRAQTTEQARRIATSRLLTHLLGVNQFFTDLAGHARTHAGAKLERWWSEQQLRRTGVFAISVTSPVRADGHAVYREDGQRVAFFLEWDGGGEQLRVLTGKLAGYAEHVTKGGPAWPVLFCLPTTRRETNLHRMLERIRVPVPVATCARDSLTAAGGPAGPVWLVHRGGDAPRRLADLAGLGDPAPDTRTPGQS